eukprot:s2138_g6.t1
MAISVLLMHPPASIPNPFVPCHDQSVTYSSHPNSSSDNASWRTDQHWDFLGDFSQLNYTRTARYAHHRDGPMESLARRAPARLTPHRSEAAAAELEPQSRPGTSPRLPSQRREQRSVRRGASLRRRADAELKREASENGNRRRRDRRSSRDRG